MPIPPPKAPRFCFPYPEDSLLPPLRVPYLATTTRSFPGIRAVLSSIPTPGTWKETPLHSKTKPPFSVASTLQTLLFFDLAAEALGREVAHDEFFDQDGTHTPGSSEMIDPRLPIWFYSELSSRWTSLARTLGTADYEEMRTRLEACCVMVVRVAMLDELGPDNKDDEHDAHLVLLSVHMLVYLILATIRGGSGAILSTSPRFGSTRLLLRMAVRRGWCLKRFNFLDSLPTHYPTLYFLCSSEPPRHNTENHRNCTRTDCFVRTSLCEPKHRSPCQDCEHIMVPVEPILKIIADGRIPLVRIDASRPGRPQLQVVPYSKDVRFLAISHVWADQQLGSVRNGLPSCQVSHLSSLMSRVPITHRGLANLVLMIPSLARWLSHPALNILLIIFTPGGWLIKDFILWFCRGYVRNYIDNLPQRYEYIWLDTFCIPQAPEDAALRNLAIGSMNLIYAAASQTIVLDAGLEKMKAGRVPSRLFSVREAPTYSAPDHRRWLDVSAQIYASNWMGRAWTLQEAALSSSLVVPLHESLAYLRVMQPHDETPFWKLISDSKERAAFGDGRRDQINFKYIPLGERWKVPMWHHVSRGLLTLLSKTLNIDQYREYASTPADRGARFINAHSRLQCRTTTMTEDLPLILMNMSDMNSNIVQSSDVSQDKMKLLMYGLGRLPVELLFSDCPRPGRGEVDAWIPREIVPEIFGKRHYLELRKEGFVFHQEKDIKPLKMFCFPSSAVGNSQTLLRISDGLAEQGEPSMFLAEAGVHSTGPVRISEHGWCLLFEDPPNRPPNCRAARFLISRKSGKTVHLHFDCPLRLTKVTKDSTPTEQQLGPTWVAEEHDPERVFVLERSSTPEFLNMGRPQNKSQNWALFSRTEQFASMALHLLETRAIKWYFGDDVNEQGHRLLWVVYFLYCILKHVFLTRGLKALSHRAWISTYSPSWTPSGWKGWFWKATNFQSPVSFMAFQKWLMSGSITISIVLGEYRALPSLVFYWVIAYPVLDLVGLFILGFSERFILKYLQILK